MMVWKETRIGKAASETQIAAGVQHQLEER
jgi:hypothetical protein